MAKYNTAINNILRNQPVTAPGSGVAYTALVTDRNIDITATNVGFWRIAQNAGQKIYFGNQATTTGVGGSITSTNARDSISLLCTSVTEFEVTSAVGNLTVV